MDSLPSETTAQQDLTTAGQRRINLIWEYTQALIALSVVAANVAIWIEFAMQKINGPIPDGLSNALFLVVGFYFSRTNHTAIGGTGRKPSQEYQGR